MIPRALAVCRLITREHGEDECTGSRSQAHRSFLTNRKLRGYHHLKINGLRSTATTSPCWLVTVVSRTTKRMVPDRPVFS